jgi:putative ABC transport system permease protein
MLPYSLRLALRHFSRKRIYSSIIILSLSVGFACTCLLLSFLVAEGNVDSFHSKKERLFEVVSSNPFGGTGRINFTTRRTRDYLFDTYPDIVNICQLAELDDSEVEINGNITSINTIQTDTSFFTLFDFPLIEGAKKDLGNGLMLTVQKARQLFGDQEALGRMVTLRTTDTTRLVAIAGIIGTPNEKSHLKFDAIFGSSPNGGVSYALLEKDVDATSVVQKINNDPGRPTLIEDGKADYYFEPIQTAYNQTWNRSPFMQTRSQTFLWVGWIVCGLILFMASFNFVNLFLLSMQERKKETGIQKTLGISLSQTLKAATTEAGIYIGSSFLLSLVLAYSLIPTFNNMVHANIDINYLFRVDVLFLVVGILSLIAFVVIITSTIQQRKTVPVSMMRNVSAKVRYSKLFFTIQFFVSITLCVCAITIIKQMKFLETEPLGFNRNIMQLNVPGKQSQDRLADLKNSVSQITGVEHVAQSAGNPISGNMIVYYELEDKSRFSPYIFSGDEDLVKTLDLTLVDGQLELRSAEDHIVNETLVKKFNMRDPVGMIIPGTKSDHVTGVVKDFTCSSFKQEIPPVIISYNEDAKNLLIDYGTANVDLLLPKVRSAWNTIFPDDYFDYKIIQDDLMKKYSEETLFYKVVLSASITSMIISCFGLFALSWAVIRSRAKEMGIRKVLGASVANILGLLTISFAKRLLLAFVFAAPAGYYVMDLWLSRFVYKAPIDTAIFVITGAALAAIAILTLGIQTLKASISSPLEEIRE